MYGKFDVHLVIKLREFPCDDPSCKMNLQLEFRNVPRHPEVMLSCQVTPSVKFTSRAEGSEHTRILSMTVIEIEQDYAGAGYEAELEVIPSLDEFLL